jgi:chromosome segregation protein
MAFLDKFRKKEGVEETRELDLAGVSPWFDQEFGGRVAQAKKSMESMHSNLTKSFMEVRDSARSLEDSVFDGKERIHSAANMIKGSFAKRIYGQINEFEKFSRGVSPGFSPMNEFCSNTERIIKDIRSASPKEVMLISRYFRRESDALTARIKSAEDQLKGLREYMDSGGAILGVSESLEKLLRKNRGLEENLKSLDGKIKSTEKRRGELKKEKKDLEGRLEEFLSGEEWTSFQKNREGLKREREELLGVENQLLNELSVVRRPFKKLNYEYGEDLSVLHRKCLGEYLESPLGALLSDQGMERLRGLLESLIELLKQGRISLKEREKEKVESLLERIDPDLSGLRERYMELERGIRNRGGTEKESGLVSEKESIQELINGNVREAEELGIELGYSLKERERLEESVDRNKREIERLILENTEKRVKIS